ncbi:MULTISPECIES: CapA family protein [Sphingobium]|uniref:Capsule synthesis protein CapA domain-containing protein n=1 Tax=Sphingobium baderi TaxID=1332080 RepID=A0A0S3EYZ2_9SPHN|nr:MULTISPECIES: CapA family protein [Sphingobium]ALR20660.1 hypothetical protein ATN00_10455 [Sphingobium baderi]WDA38403.1 CapA family protein [Sphingobium sp. YC-XJ3]SCW79310.1 UDP-N-acetylmuramyl pentapeptide synthase [Sphingobium faniae]
MTDNPISLLMQSVYDRLKEAAVPVGQAGSEYILFFSFTDTHKRARVETYRGSTFDDAWRRGVSRLDRITRKNPNTIRWLRVDLIDGIRHNDWGTLKQQLTQVKRNYCRQGISLDPNCRHAFLETEINANAMFYGGPKYPHCVVNEKNFQRYARLRHGLAGVDFSDATSVWMFSSRGFFIDLEKRDAVHEIAGPGRSAGRRIIDTLDEDILTELLQSSSSFLAGQVGEDGRFIYGWHPCFDREIPAYNALRHASTTYAMIEAWEVTRDARLWAAIDRSLGWLCHEAIRTATLPNGTEAAFLVDVGNEIKLGANAVAILAFTRHAAVTGCIDNLPLLEKLALGVQYMQRSRDGSFVHVLNFPDLTLKESFRTIYYEGEAAFGLMRLYSLTKDERWLTTVEKAFEHFIAKEHWRHNDHWLSYCVNELTRYRPDERYFRFGIQNVKDYLDFILNRITTFPTLLELMMAAQAMLDRIETMPEMRHLLDEIDLPKFQRALHYRARYLLNGHFWPELAMFFANPQRIVGSFFIRHHAFRVRIDDVEHYLSGLVAYRYYLLSKSAKAQELIAAPQKKGPVLAWGGDVNLGRRQHYRTADLEAANIVRVPALAAADIAVVNLECVVTTKGEQGTKKGENGPYYYRARPEMACLLSQAGVDVVATANNHSGDYGADAVVDQGEWLDRAGIGHVGTGRTVDEAFAPLFRQAGDLTVAIFSIDSTQHRFAATDDRPGSAYLPPEAPGLWCETMTRHIAAAREKANVVVVAVHWGTNLVEEPDADEIAVGHALIEAGADAVLGASAHVLQGVEIYQQRPIIHDAGDLLFDSIRSTAFDAGLFSLELSNNGVERVVFTPLAGGFGFTRQLEGPDAIEAIRKFGQKCETMGTHLQCAVNGTGIIELSPPVRRRKPRRSTKPASNGLMTSPILMESAYTLDDRWLVDDVPEDARIDPVQLGPLTLLGVRVKPKQIQRRRMLWVETFWRADAPVAEDIRLDIRGVPVATTTMKPWGLGMDHDPCDWLMPTTRWKPGQIYRDYYGLRPPYIKDWDNIDLQLTVGAVSGREAIMPVALPLRIKLDAPTGSPADVTRMTRNYRTDFPADVLRPKAGQTWTAEQIELVTGGKWLVRPPAGWFVRSIIRGFGHVDHVDDPVLYVASHYDALAFHEQFSSAAKSWDTHHVLARHAGRLAGAIVARPVPGLPKGFPLLQVDDPIRALIELGFAARQRFEGDVIAITGTAGKSTTVGMLKHLLGKETRALASFGNYNSRVGAPALLANLAGYHSAAIVEIAQSALWMRRGPITRQIKPTVALITELGISQARSERIASVKDTAKFKSRIFDGLTGPAVAVVGEHLACFDTVLTAAQEHAKRVVTFGDSPKATLRVLDRKHTDTGSQVQLVTPEGELIDLHVPLPGSGMMNNALAAMSVLYATGYDLQAAARQLAGFEPEEGRLRRLELPMRDGGTVDVIDDSWNATVSSMLNAISVLKEAPTRSDGRKIAILGRIVHLGDLSQSLHESLATPLLDAAPDLILTHGEEMQFLRAVLPHGLMGPHFSSASALAEYLHRELRSGDLLLIKGSRRDSDFGEVCERLTQLVQSRVETSVAAE